MTESGKLLARARRDGGLTQVELARRTGLSRSVISAYETGHREPGADTLLRLLRGTGHDVELVSTIERSRPAAKKLEQACAMAMTLPARKRGPLTYPAWHTLTQGSS